MNGRIALVTGASSGFGAATADRLAAHGMRVFGTSRREAPDRPGVEMLRLDVHDERSVLDCVDAVIARAGRIDVLVNNAGVAMAGACEETSAAEARDLFETNVFGVMRMVAAVLPAMRARGEGVVVNVGSISGFIGVPFHGVYAASKHALAGYSEALRFEVEPLGVRVALIEPAAHNTGIAMSAPRAPIGVYDRGRNQVEGVIRGQIERGAPPGAVVDAIVRAIDSRARFPRYRVGRKAWLALVLRCLPAWLFERAVRREFGL